MTRQRIPEAVLSAAHERSRARAARDWPEADRLRQVIESAGWRIVDTGTDFALSPAAPPDIDDGRRVRYGASAAVPSRLDEPTTGLATIVLIATEYPDDLTRTLVGLRQHAPAGTGVVVVADDPSEAQASALDAIQGADADPHAMGSDPTGLATEVVWTSARLGHAAAGNIGIRRAVAPVVILLDTSVEPAGDFVSPLVEALADPSVAVVGGWGITSMDLRQFADAPAGDVDAIEGYCLAFRRDDFVARGPLDERFRFYRNLDIWWSLVLRDAAPTDDVEDPGPPRRAVALGGLPLIRHEHRGWTSLPEDERTRQSKRNFYRIIDRFGSREDLLIGRSGR